MQECKMAYGYVVFAAIVTLVIYNFLIVILYFTVPHTLIALSPAIIAVIGACIGIAVIWGIKWRLE